MLKKDMLKGEVLWYLLKIPQWKLMTYESLWKVFNIHPRKVWKILKQNEETEIFPCYKVLETKTKIWFYNWKWGIHWKLQKIKDDWIEVIDWKIDEKYFI